MHNMSKAHDTHSLAQNGSQRAFSKEKKLDTKGKVSSLGDDNLTV